MPWCSMPTAARAAVGCLVMAHKMNVIIHNLTLYLVEDLDSIRGHRTSLYFPSYGLITGCELV